jgi:hypothetical protein
MPNVKHLFVLLCFLCTASLSAQETSPSQATSDYRLGEDGRIVQRS